MGNIEIIEKIIQMAKMIDENGRIVYDGRMFQLLDEIGVSLEFQEEGIKWFLR